MKTLNDLLVHELKDLYDAEHQIVAALPKIAEAVSAPELREAVEHHLEQTRQHIARLEQVFGTLDQEPERETCDGMKGLLKEGRSAIEDEMNDDVRDAALIAAMQRVEHYEMAGYGTVRTYAHLLGHEEAARLLQETLDEEELTDKRLSQLANDINRAAQ
jgi:ferritin-like metal-binding protein YciE